MSFHIFWVDRKWANFEETTAVFHYFRNGPFSDNINETIDKQFNRRLPPSRLLIVAPIYAKADILKKWGELDEESTSRLDSTSHVALAAYGCDGKLDSTESLKGQTGGAWPPSDEDLLQITREGMRQLVESSKTILHAPEGYHFRKPSDHLNTTFVRAGNMFKDPASLALVHYLLRRVAPVTTNHLYVDSVTILPLALHFREECAHFRKHCASDSGACANIYGEPTISNFHSYSIDPDLRFSGAHDYFVLISATSSGSLRKRLEEQHGATLDRVHHLLALSPDKTLAECSLYFEEQDDLSKIPADSLKQISIPSEEFVASHGEARAVKISRAHVSKGDRAALSDPTLQPQLELRFGGGYHSGAVPFGLSESSPGFTDRFQKWLDDELALCIPNNVSYIVSGAGARSHALGEYTLANLQRRLSNQISHVALENLLKGEKLEKVTSNSILIVCDEESSGDQLLAASRVLREYPDANRHYLVGWAFPETQALHNRIITNIRLSPWEGRKYGWSYFSVTPIGRVALHSSWRAESDILTRQTVASFALHEPLMSALSLRQTQLRGAQLKADQLFLPKFDGSALELQHNSIFLAASKLSQVAAYLSVAGALQRAREGKNGNAQLAADECFDNNPFIDTVLDPDMFSRFNDGVFQAAFLRASAADELNYSRSPAFSRHMAGIIKSILINRHGASGEAALEFLFALRSKRLRLDRSDRDELEKLISSDPDLAIIWRLFGEVPPF
jgi:hypothetical protein